GLFYGRMRVTRCAGVDMGADAAGGGGAADSVLYRGAAGQYRGQYETGTDGRNGIRNRLSLVPYSAADIFYLVDVVLCAAGTQSAIKTLVSPSLAALRFEAKTSFLPSGENIGKPSKVSS